MRKLLLLLIFVPILCAKPSQSNTLHDPENWCKDRYPSECSLLATRDFCTNNEDEMKFKCSKSCKFCSVPFQCRDGSYAQTKLDCPKGLNKLTRKDLKISINSIDFILAEQREDMTNYALYTAEANDVIRNRTLGMSPIYSVHKHKF
jgi:hypothetical protein